MTVTVAEWESCPLVPVIVTKYTPAEPGDPEQNKVEVETDDPTVTLEGLRLHVSPAEGEEDCTSVTTPVKPFACVTLTVEDEAVPATAETEIGFADIAKSVI